MQLLLTLLYVCATAILWSRLVDAFSIIDYTHYLDYLPNRMEGSAVRAAADDSRQLLHLHDHHHHRHEHHHNHQEPLIWTTSARRLILPLIFGTVRWR